MILPITISIAGDVNLRSGRASAVVDGKSEAITARNCRVTKAGAGDRESVERSLESDTGRRRRLIRLFLLGPSP